MSFTGPNDRWLHRRGLTYLAPDGSEIGSSALVESLDPDGFAVVVAVTRRLDF